ncbi:HAD family hydrolase [Streptococcus suis]|uniref:HAD family hydrolase n=1 Tax=Streptococcus sp. ZY1909104 TaxID=3233335 RepID=UPI0014323B10|nr:HAD family hydrolase [Streptococcus suis]
MKRYKNYIFDFYGTLVDIVTDENKLELWEKLAAIYHSFGCTYGARQLRSAFQEAASEAELDLIRISPYQYVEIDLEKVFIQLLTDEKYRRPTQMAPADLKTFGQMVATVFRVLSREKLETYTNTLSTLARLKDEGARLFILSNAQRVFTQAEIEIMGCAAFMEQIYISSDYRIKKPEPEFLQGVLDENQLDPAETVFVGNDLTSDIAIAQALGLDGVLINTFPYSPDEIAAYQEKGWQFEIIEDISELVGE